MTNEVYIQEAMVTVDMPASKERTRLVATLKAGRQGAGIINPRDREITYDDIAQLWDAAGNSAQAKMIRQIRDIVRDMGSINRNALNGNPKHGTPIDGECIRGLMRAIGNTEAARLHRQAEALALDPKKKTNDPRDAQGASRKLTTGDVRTLTAGAS